MRVPPQDVFVQTALAFKANPQAIAAVEIKTTGEHESVIRAITMDEVPIVVAMNKIDLEGVDTNRVVTQLTEHELTPSEWGGDVEVVPTSAIKGIGMDELLETLLTVAELNEYTANPNRQAIGVCLEAEQQGDRGVVAKLIVQNGTLWVGDIIVCGAAHGRVRAMSDPLTGEAIPTWSTLRFEGDGMGRSLVFLGLWVEVGPIGSFPLRAHRERAPGNQHEHHPCFLAEDPGILTFTIGILFRSLAAGDAPEFPQARSRVPS